MTRNEYFAQDILVRLRHAQEVFLRIGETLVFEDEGIALFASDVITDAIVVILKLREGHG